MFWSLELNLIVLSSCPFSRLQLLNLDHVCFIYFLLIKLMTIAALELHINEWKIISEWTHDTWMFFVKHIQVGFLVQLLSFLITQAMPKKTGSLSLGLSFNCFCIWSHDLLCLLMQHLCMKFLNLLISINRLDIAIEMVYLKRADKGIPVLSIIDDGCGMTHQDIMTMISLGHRKLYVDDMDHIGRFGVGLKVAFCSFLSVCWVMHSLVAQYLLIIWIC